MYRKKLLSEITKFMMSVKDDYQNNIINKDKYELMYNELDSLTENFFSTNLILLTTKFHTIKSIYNNEIKGD